MEWTDEVIARLQDLWSQGLSTAEIGRQLSITKNAVVGKAHRLGLPARPSPIRKQDGEGGRAATTDSSGRTSRKPRKKTEEVASSPVHSAPSAEAPAPSTPPVTPPASASAAPAPAPTEAAVTRPPQPAAAPVAAKPSSPTAAPPAPAAAPRPPSPAERAPSPRGPAAVDTPSASSRPAAATAKSAEETDDRADAVLAASLRPMIRSITGDSSPRRGPSCCWPIGDPGTPGFHFCGAKPLPGKPYCAEHAALAYVKLRDRRDNVA